MADLSYLISCAGTWTGINKLQDPHSNIQEESASTAEIKPILAGKFVRIDYTWQYKEAPQEGMMLVGFETKTNTINVYWIDSWHMGDAVMHCTGKDNEGYLSVMGSYAAPPGPDWGWRINLFADNKTFRIEMFNIWPEGKEEPAVTMSYENV